MEIPEEDGLTGFVDQARAYDLLPEATKRRIEGLEVVYRWDIDMSRNRSIRGMLVLQSLGFRNVRSLNGGTIAWAEQGLPTDQ